MAPEVSTQSNAWESLETLTSEVITCTRCELSRGRTNAVPGEGSSHPTIMFIGEGPGFNEDQQGRPFVGRAGELLDLLLSLVPLQREDVYITNVVKCRPPDNRDPLPGEVAACWPYLEAQISFLQPRVIATLGRHSLARFFPDARISTQHGKPMRWRDRIVFPLYHPAAGLRSTRLREVLEADFRQLPAAVIASLTPAAAVVAEGRGPSLPVGPDDADTDDTSQLPLF